MKKRTILLPPYFSESRSAITEAGTPPQYIVPPLLRRVAAALRLTSRRLALATLLGCVILLSGGEALGADPTGTLKITPSHFSACGFRSQEYVLVGTTVSADTSGISDSDGMSTPNWRYQWKRVKQDWTVTDLGTARYHDVTLDDWSRSASADYGTYLVLQATYTDDGSADHTVTTYVPTGPSWDNEAAYKVVRPVSPPVPAGWDRSNTVTLRGITSTEYEYDVPENQDSVTLSADLSTYGAGPVDYSRASTRGTEADWDKDNARFESKREDRGPTLKFKKAPDFENPHDENRDNVYRAALRLRDKSFNDGHLGCYATWSGRTFDTYSIKIVVTDAVEQDDLLNTPDPPSLERATFNSATIVWTAPGRRDPVIPEATGYELEWREEGQAVQQESLTVTTKTLSDLQADTTYNVRVRATNGYAGSPWSDWLSFTTPRQEVMSEVPVLSSRNLAPESVMLQWTVPSDGISPDTSYDLEYREEGTHSTQTESGLTTTAKTLEGLQPGVTYEARVRVSPDGTWSEWHTFTTPEKRERGTGDGSGDDNEETEEEEMGDSCPDPPGITAQYLENNQDRETLKGFVKEALCPISAELEASGQEGFEEQNYREEGHWRHGSVYLFLISDDGTVVFDGFHEELNGEELPEEDHKGNDVWDKISGAVEEDGYGYTEYYWDDPSKGEDDNPNSDWIDRGESPGTSLKTVYVEEFSTSEGDFIIGSGIYVEEEEKEGPEGTDESMKGSSGEDGEGGCTVAGSEMKSTVLGLFLTLVVLFCTVLRRGRCW